jgi:hypothetical protein
VVLARARGSWPRASCGCAPSTPASAPTGDMAECPPPQGGRDGGPRTRAFYDALLARIARPAGRDARRRSPSAGAVRRARGSGACSPSRPHPRRPRGE